MKMGIMSGMPAIIGEGADASNVLIEIRAEDTARTLKQNVLISLKGEKNTASAPDAGGPNIMLTKKYKL